MRAAGRAARSPAISVSVVVLPQPLGPSSVKNSPVRMVRSTPSSAATEPKRLPTSRSSTAKLATGYVRIRITSGMPLEQYSRSPPCRVAGTRYDDHAAGSHPSDPEATITTVETVLGSLTTAQLGPRLALPHISDDILPALRAAGVTTDQIEQMLVRNPRAIFEGAG